MRIAISVSEKEKAKGAQSKYFQALVAAGAEPEEVHLVSAGDSSRVRPQDFDGVLFAGGADVDPERYGERKKYESVKVDSTRDKFEFPLLERARQSGLPVFGICRGLQMINVGFGGTLYQDLKEDKNAELDHQQGPAHPRQESTHQVTVTDSESVIAGALPAHCGVNSMHHQAVDRIGRGLKATAYSEDGFVEAIEAAGGDTFLFAVQWHPEEIADHPEQRKIFETFVEKCRQTAARRQASAPAE